MSRSMSVVALLTVVVLVAHAAPARAEQSVVLNVGYFSLRGEDARASGDVLVENMNFLSFLLEDFNGASFGGDWLVGLGDYVEVGAGIGYYRRTVPSVYARFQNRDGSEITQDLRFRLIPVTATVRFLPLGRRSGFQPYIGAGVAVISWRYSEVGEFVDMFDRSIFRGRYVSEGTGVGPAVVAGVRVPVGSQFSIGGELRYHSASGTLDETQDFASDTIDLGGLTSQFTFGVKF